MNNFHIILEISATIVSIQKFFLVVSQTHETFGCANGSSCKVGQFLERINEILNSDTCCDDIRTSFVEHCVHFNDVFNCIYQLIQPENSGMIKKFELLTNSKEKEST